MMSRLLLRAGLGARPARKTVQSLARPAMVKCMSTSSTKKEESVVDIIKEFGALPFAGFASAILVGKELFMVNEEVLVLGIFSGVIFYGYVTLYDSVNQDFADYASDIKK